MFRIRESFPDNLSVYLWFDGRLTEEDLKTARKVLTKYMDEGKKISVNLSNLAHVGWPGKRFLKEIKGQVSFEDEPEYLKIAL